MKHASREIEFEAHVIHLLKKIRMYESLVTPNQVDELANELTIYV